MTTKEIRGTKGRTVERTVAWESDGLTPTNCHIQARHRKFGDFCIQIASLFFQNILIAWKRKSGIKM